MAGLIAYGAYVPVPPAEAIRDRRRPRRGRRARAPGPSPPTTRTPRRWASRRPAAALRQRRRPCSPAAAALRHRQPAVPRQDERQRHPRRARPRPRRPGRRRRSARCGRASARCCRRPSRPTPTLAVLSDVRTACPAAPTSATAATPPPRSSSAATRRTGRSPSSSPQARPPTSSSTAGALPGAPASRVWEERFGEHVYGPLADAAFADALKQAGLTPGDIDLSSSPALARPGGASASPAAPGVGRGVADDLTAADRQRRHRPARRAARRRRSTGPTPGADDRPRGAGRRRHRARAPHHRRASPAHRRAPTGGGPDRRRQRRAALRHVPDLARASSTGSRPAGPTPTARRRRRRTAARRYKYGFVGHAAATRVRHRAPAAGAGLRAVQGASTTWTTCRWPTCRGTVATFTIDRLAFSPSPPVVAAVVDFDGGGRFSCELTDVDPAAVAIGDRVEMTFRRMRHRRRRPQLLLEGPAGRAGHDDDGGI